MNYKALMLDVDGTLVHYDYEAVPTDAVATAIKKAQERVSVSIVTGRSFSSIEPILKKLELHTGFAVVNNGAHVLDIETKELLYNQPIDKKDAEEVVKALRAADIPFYLKQDLYDDAYKDGPFGNDQKVTDPHMFYTDEVLQEDKADTLLKKFSRFPNLSFYKVPHKDPEKFGLNILHVNATKLHGVEAIMERQGLQKEEIIGAGDSYNDFPLLMASGLKVAMGNAVEDLKAIADYVAPSVYDDGLVDVVERFILSS